MLSTAPFAHAQQLPLQSPTDLSSEAYSSSAVEVFWSRTAGAVEYTITLLGSDSPAAIVTQTTNGASISPSSPIANGPLLENTRLVVYSNTAAELVWDRPEPEAGVNRVEVLRGTGIVATESLGRFDATSFFDNTREPGVAYSYAIISRDKKSLA